MPMQLHFRMLKMWTEAHLLTHLWLRVCKSLSLRERCDGDSANQRRNLPLLTELKRNGVHSLAILTVDLLAFKSIFCSIRLSGFFPLLPHLHHLPSGDRDGGHGGV